NTATGTFEVQTGFLDVAGGAPNSRMTFQGARFVTAAGTAIRLDGNHDWTGTYTGTGDGTAQLVGGEYVIGAAGATFNFPAGILQWMAGNIRAGGGVLTNTDTIALSGNADKWLGSTLRNSGTIIHTTVTADNGRLYISGGLLENLASGLYDFRSDTSVFGNSNPPGGIINAGTFRRSAGPVGGRSGVDAAPCLNAPSGTFEAQTGFLDVAGGAPNSRMTFQGARFVTAAGTAIRLDGNHDWTGSYAGTGDGTVQLVGGEYVIGAAGATFNFPAGRLQWMAGTTRGGAGVLTNPDTIPLSGNADKWLGSTLRNSGTIIHTTVTADNGRLYISGGLLENLASGLYDFRSDTSVFG